MYALAYASTHSVDVGVSVPGLQFHWKLRPAVPGLRIRSVDELGRRVESRSGTGGAAALCVWTRARGLSGGTSAGCFSLTPVRFC